MADHGYHIYLHGSMF